MSVTTPLDRLCAAACVEDDGADAADAAGPAEIRVVEVDAYASVADLIHAAVAANGGRASLRDVYDVCARHGRIAYRRAGGSRLITHNEHWKSQIRHALYTGARFARAAAGADAWELTPAHAAARPELAKVLVRADDATRGVVAAAAPAPGGGRGGGAGGGAAARRPPTGGRPRRRRAGRGAASEDEGEGGAARGGAAGEGICDSADSGGEPGAARTRAAAAAAAAAAARATADDASTQASDGQVALPRLRGGGARGARSAAAPAWAASPDAPGVSRATAPTPPRRSAAAGASSASSDPTCLRWGSVALRSGFTFAADSSLSAGRTPVAAAAAALRHAPPSAPRGAAAPGSAEAASSAYFPWFGLPPLAPSPAAATPGTRPSKRRAAQPVPPFAVPAPLVGAAGAPHGVPPQVAAQFADAVRQMQAALAAQQRAAGPGAAALNWPAAAAGFPLAAHAPVAMLPLHPAVLAAAAQAHQEVLQAAAAAAAVPAEAQRPQTRGAAADRPRRA